jgi:hypothetical protein
VSALDKQPGGSHYKDYAIQPVDFITKNKVPFIEGNVIKYVMRHRQKNGRQDLEKAIHYLEMLLELEYPAPEIPPIVQAVQRAWIEAHEIYGGSS